MTLICRCCKCLARMELPLPDDADEFYADVRSRFALCPTCQPREARRDVEPIEIVEPRHARLPYLDS